MALVLDPMLQQFQERITAQAGAEYAERILTDAIKNAGLSQKPKFTADELYRIADQLAAVGGYVTVLARLMRVRALSAGATVPS